MTLLYITADRVGIQTGGGRVTLEESEALKSLGPCEVWDQSELNNNPVIQGDEEPWRWDDRAAFKIIDRDHRNITNHLPQLCHCYAGTFTNTLGILRHNGCKIGYTAAAHSIEISRREHERLGIAYDYPHLTQPEQFKRYVAGYLLADVLICPSTHSANVMRGFGATNRIEVIPHGCDLPEMVSPPPTKFVLGYLGSFGADKGIPYLLLAWKKLNYPDAVLRLGGRDSAHPYVRDLINRFGGGNVEITGWVDDIGTFYQGTSVYCQPSCSEGFGLEVLEVLAHGRPVICSDGAGAADMLTNRPGSHTNADLPFAGAVVPACNVDALAAVIDEAKKSWNLEAAGKAGRAIAANYTWEQVRERYKAVWRGLLN